MLITGNKGNLIFTNTPLGAESTESTESNSIVSVVSVVSVVGWGIRE